MKVNVIVFPGSNCDHDIAYLCGAKLDASVQMIWHREQELKRPDLVVLPGGFSYGDYLRTGALAKLSPIMGAVKKFAEQGGLVIGICNGFQILCEAGLLPGVLLRNQSMRFISQFVHLRVEQSTPFTANFATGEIVRWPVAHFEGNYFAEPEVLDRIEGQGQVVFRYCRSDGVIDEFDPVANPNGSQRSIAGICNIQRKVVGLMPHPERAAETVVGLVGGDSGRKMFELLNS